MSVEEILYGVLGVIVLIPALMYCALRWRAQHQPNNAAVAEQPRATAVEQRVVNDECTVEPIDGMGTRMYPCDHRWATHVHITLYGEVLTAQRPYILEELCGDCVRKGLLDRSAYPRCAACGYVIIPGSQAAARGRNDGVLPYVAVAHAVAGDKVLCCSRRDCHGADGLTTSTWTGGYIICTYY